MAAPALRIVFMGTPTFSVPALETLAKHHEVVGVYTQPDRAVGRGLEVQAPPVKQKALELGIPVFQPEKLSLPGEYEKLQALAPDVIVVVAYGQLLRQNVLDLPKQGCINIHASLLPRWRGAAPIHWSILAGDTKTGVCTMKMVLKLDAGDVYHSDETEILPEESVMELHDRLSSMGGRLILKTLSELRDGPLTGSPQDESLVTYASKLTKDMEELRPELSAVELSRRVRALNPWPGTTLALDVNGKKERLKVRQARLSESSGASAGSLHERSGMLLLGTADGSLQLLRVQPEGKKEMDAASFINGLRGRGLSLPLRVGSGS